MFRTLRKDRPLSNNQARENFLALAARGYFFGGSKVIGVDDGQNTTHDFIDGMAIVLDGRLLDGLILTFRCELKNEPGGSCTPQLWNETTGTIAGVGYVTNAAAEFSRQGFPVTLAPGRSVYRARLVRSNAELNAWAIGYLDITPSTRQSEEGGNN